MPIKKGYVQFKDEGEIEGITIGPVWVDGEKRDGWMFKPDALKLAKSLGLEFEDV